MAFRSDFLMKTLYCLVFFSLAGCSDSKDEKYMIGIPIDQFNPIGLEFREGPEQQKFYGYDEFGKRIVFVDPQSKEVDFSPSLGDRSEGQAWLPGSGDSHAFHIKGGRVFVVSAANPDAGEALKVSGTIESYAAEPNEGLYAFVDEFFSIALLKVDPEGQVLAQWTGGAIIDGANNIVAGEMISGGKLVLLTDQQSIIVVDVEGSLASQKWVYEIVALPIESASWAGKIEGRTDRVLILDKDSLDLVDLTSKSIISTQTIEDANVSKRGIDHAFLYDSNTDKYSFYSAGAGDAIDRHEVKISGLIPEQTHLSDQNLVLTTDSRQIVKVRLVDGLVQASYSNTQKALVGISADYAVSMFESPLGYLEILDLATGKKTVVEGHNREVLQN